jgi:hypothetical protein
VHQLEGRFAASVAMVAASDNLSQFSTQCNRTEVLDYSKATRLTVRLSTGSKKIIHAPHVIG